MTTELEILKNNTTIDLEKLKKGERQFLAIEDIKVIQNLDLESVGPLIRRDIFFGCEKLDVVKRDLINDNDPDFSDEDSFLEFPVIYVNSEGEIILESCYGLKKEDRVYVTRAFIY